MPRYRILHRRTDVLGVPQPETFDVEVEAPEVGAAISKLREKLSAEGVAGLRVDGVRRCDPEEDRSVRRAWPARLLALLLGLSALMHLIRG
jgi:hypothetical protein